MKHLTSIAALIFSTSLFFACSGSKKTETEVTSTSVSTDSLITGWNNAWNSNDSISLAAMFTSNTVVLSGNWKVTGKDSIMQNWVNKQFPRMSNLKTTKITEGNSSEMYFQTGFYTLDITRNDSVVGTNDGNYSIIWKRQPDNSLKIELVHMGDI